MVQKMRSSSADNLLINSEKTLLLPRTKHIDYISMEKIEELS